MQVKIRDIQHFLYCPHRWGLLNIDCAWAENYYVVKANLLHDRVHNSENRYISKGKEVLTAVFVHNDAPAYDIYGVVDCIELVKSKNGIQIAGYDDKFNLCIVEYKPTMPKSQDFNKDDALQVFAQKICVDKTFNTDCECYIYYADTKKRIKLPFKEEYDEYDKLLKRVLADIREYTEKSEIPKILKGQKCNGCSLKDICMPIKSSIKTVRSRIDELLEDV